MARKKIKIAIFHLAFIYSGGGERLVLEEAIGLKKLGYDVTVFAPVINKEKSFPGLMEKVNVQKILPRILPKWFPDVELLSILSACVLIPFVSVKFREYDIYFGANQPGPWIAYILSKIHKKPYVVYLAQPTRLLHPRLIDQEAGLRLRDGFSMLRFLAFFFKPLIQFADARSIRKADIVFANGSYMTGVLREVYHINPVNCPAGSRRYEMREKDRERRFRGFLSIKGKRIAKPFVLVTNRHFAHKKFEYAIEAVKLLDKHIPLVITGEETAYTKELKKQYAARTDVYFTGLVSETELKLLYWEAAVYMYPAPEEDFGMGIVEAMAHGVPVIAWENAGPTGIITHGYDGLLARPFNVEDFSQNVWKLLNDKKLFTDIVTHAYTTIGRFFTFDRHNRILDREFKKLIHEDQYF